MCISHSISFNTKMYVFQVKYSCHRELKIRGCSTNFANKNFHPQELFLTFWRFSRNKLLQFKLKFHQAWGIGSFWSRLSALKIEEQSRAKEPDLGSGAGAKELDYGRRAKRKKKSQLRSCGSWSKELQSGSWHIWELAPVPLQIT